MLAQIAGATEEHAEHITGHYPPNTRLPLCRAAAAAEPACCGTQARIWSKPRCVRPGRQLVLGSPRLATRWSCTRPALSSKPPRLTGPPTATGHFSRVALLPSPAPPAALHPRCAAVVLIPPFANKRQRNGMPHRHHRRSHRVAARAPLLLLLVQALMNIRDVTRAQAGGHPRPAGRRSAGRCEPDRGRRHLPHRLWRVRGHLRSRMAGPPEGGGPMIVWHVNSCV